MGIPTVWMKCVTCGRWKVCNPAEELCRCGGRLELDTRQVWRRARRG